MSEGPRTAFIHVGVAKTGTTAIQAALYGAAEALAAQGFHYVRLAENHSIPLAQAFWTPEAARGLARLAWVDTEAGADAFRADLRDRLAQDLAESAPRHVILSAEGLADFYPSEFEDLLQMLHAHVDAVQVIAYAREPVAWMQSAAQQAVMATGDSIENSLLRPRVVDYSRRLDAIRDAVGPEQFHLRAYQGGSEGGDIVTDFCAALGLAPGTLASQRLNSTSSAASVHAHAALNTLAPPFADGRFSPLRAGGVDRLCHLPGARFTLPQDTVDIAHEALARDRAWLLEAFGAWPFHDWPGGFGPLDPWLGPQAEDWADFAQAVLETANAAADGAASSDLHWARRRRGEDATIADQLLSSAWRKATTRDTLGRIATEAVAHTHPDCDAIFTKQDILRRADAPEAGDAPLDPAYPFDRAPTRAGT